jgi:hypothetical protein
MDGGPSPVAAEMSEDSVLKKIDEDTKEFFAVRNIHEEAYFADLPLKFRSKVVEKLAGRAIEAKGLCAPETFEEGLGAIAGFIDDIIYDAPKALQLFAIIIKGAGLDESRQSSIAAKSSENNDKPSTYEDDTFPTAFQLQLGGLCVAHLFSISFILTDFGLSTLSSQEQ